MRSTKLWKILFKTYRLPYDPNVRPYWINLVAILMFTLLILDVPQALGMGNTIETTKRRSLCSAAFFCLHGAPVGDGACDVPETTALQLLFALLVLLALLILLVTLDAVVLLHNSSHLPGISLLLWRKRGVLSPHFPGKGVARPKSLCYNVSLENCVIF